MYMYMSQSGSESVVATTVEAGSKKQSSQEVRLVLGEMARIQKAEVRAYAVTQS